MRAADRDARRCTTSLFALTVLGLTPGCTGLALGIHAPGADTRLEGGAIAVDDRTDTTFVLSTHPTAAGSERRLYAFDANGGTPRRMPMAGDRADRRLIFPNSGVLLMSEIEGRGERLTLFDRDTLAEKKTVEQPARYWGTRLSPSRRWIAVADNDSDATPIHVIDATTLEARVIPHGGDWLEGVWMNESDELVAAVFEDGDANRAPSVRVLSWSMDAVREADFTTDASGVWDHPSLDVSVAGKMENLWLSHTWVGTSPDDRWIALPLCDAASHRHELLVIDRQNGTQRIVEGAKGPVGFSGDSKTIVSYTWVDEPGGAAPPCVSARASKRRRQGARDPSSIDAATTQGESPLAGERPALRERLLLIDVETLTTRPLVVPAIDRFNFHLSGTVVAVAPAYEVEGHHPPLYLFDTRTPERGTLLTPARAHLFEFIERPQGQELWLISHGSLSRLDLPARRHEAVSLPFRAEHLNYLPGHDLLVLDDPTPRRRVTPDRLVFIDPHDRTVARVVAVPSEAPAKASSSRSP